MNGEGSAPHYNSLSAKHSAHKQLLFAPKAVACVTVLSPANGRAAEFLEGGRRGRRAHRPSRQGRARPARAAKDKATGRVWVAHAGTTVPCVLLGVMLSVDMQEGATDLACH